MSENQVEEAPDDYPAVQTAEARALSKIGLTIVEGGRQAWATFEYSDNALPGESPAESTERINLVAINGAFEAAENTRYAMQQLNKKKEQ